MIASRRPRTPRQSARAERGAKQIHRATAWPIPSNMTAKHRNTCSSAGSIMVDLWNDPWSRTPAGLHHREYFIYLRTRVGIGHDDAPINAIEMMFGDHPEMFAPDGIYTPFANGFAFRISVGDTSAVQLAEEWTEHLKLFDAWAIHDGISDVAESFRGGPTSVAFQRLRFNDVEQKPLPLTQAFVVFFDPDRDDRRYDQESATDFLKSAWPHTTAPAFHFSNGRILLVRTREAVITLFRRMEVKLPSQQKYRPRNRPNFHEIALYDGTRDDGMAFFGKSPAWNDVSLYDLSDAEAAETG